MAPSRERVPVVIVEYDEIAKTIARRIAEIIKERRKEGGPIEVTLFGKYEDKFVKTRDGWRFRERIWTPDTFRGSNIPVAASPVPGAE